MEIIRDMEIITETEDKQHTIYRTNMGRSFFWVIHVNYTPMHLFNSVNLEPNDLL